MILRRHTVFETSTAFLEYNTGAAAATFVVNAPAYKFYSRPIVVPSAHKTQQKEKTSNDKQMENKFEYNAYK